MSFLDIPAEVQSAPSFDIVKYLFGEADEKTASKSSIGESTVVEQQPSQERPVEDDQISAASTSSIRRMRRRSSVVRESFILESVRKMSKIPEYESVESVLEARSSLHCSPVTLEQLETEHAEMLPAYEKCLDVTHEKLFKLGTASVDKAGKRKPASAIGTLLDQMITTRSTLSKNRRKLLSHFQKLEHLKIRDALLDLQIKNIRLEELHDLQVEVSRTTEKIDETGKQMAKARTEYESDISKAAHVREKWFAFQYKMLNKVDDLSELQRAIQEHREFLCGLLRRKKQLREENAELRKECRIIDNKPLLRKYDRVLAEIEQIKYQKDRFAGL